MNSKMRSKLFPWMESINSQAYVAGFNGNINLHIDVMKNLFCEVSPEIVEIVAEKNFNRAETLFQVLHHYVFSFHMCNISRNKEMKLPNTAFLLLVSCLVDLQIYLCRRDPGSDHLQNCIRDMYLFIGTDVSSLWDVLLHCKLLKKKHSAVLVPIMKRVMQKVPTAISSPEEYMKMLLLMRHWKMFCDLNTDKYDILNLAMRVRPPDDLFNWLSKLHNETPAKFPFASTKKLFAKHFLCKKCPKGFCKKLQEVLRRSVLNALDIRSSTDEDFSNYNYTWSNYQTSLVSADAQLLASDQNDAECGGFLIDCSGLDSFPEQQLQVPEFSTSEGENAGKKSKKRHKKRNGNKGDHDASENCADETLSEIGVKRKKSASHNRDSDTHSSSEEDLESGSWHPDQSDLFYIEEKVSVRERDLESATPLYDCKGFDGILGNQDSEGESAKKKSRKRHKKRDESESQVSMSSVQVECNVENSHTSSPNLLNCVEETFLKGHPVDPYSLGDTGVKTSQINEKGRYSENLIGSSVVCGYSTQPSLQQGPSSKKKGKKLKKNPPCENEIPFHVTESVDEVLEKNKLPDTNVDFCSENLAACGSTKKRKRKKSMVVEEMVLLDYENSVDEIVPCENEASEFSSSNICSFDPDRKLKKTKKEEESQIRKRKRSSTPATNDVLDVSTYKKATESFVEIPKHDSSEPRQKNKTWVGDSAVNDDIVSPGKKKKRRPKGKNSNVREVHDSVDAENSSLANDEIVSKNSFDCSGDFFSASSSFNSSFSENNVGKPKRRKKGGKHELVCDEFDSTSQNKNICNNAMKGTSESSSKDRQSRVSISELESSVDNRLNLEKSRKEKKQHEFPETTGKLENEEVDRDGSNLSESHSVVTLLNLDIGPAKGKDTKYRSDSSSSEICASDESFSTIEKNNDSVIDLSGISNTSSILCIEEDENRTPSSSKRRSYEGIKSLERAAPLSTEDCTGNDSLGSNDLKVKDTSEIHKETECDDLSLGGVETYCSESLAAVAVHTSPRATLQAKYHETPSSVKMQKGHDEKFCNSLVNTSVSLTSSTSVVHSPNKKGSKSRSSSSKKESFISENKLESVMSSNLTGNHGQVNVTGFRAVPLESPRKVTDSKSSGNFGITCPSYEKSPRKNIWLPFLSQEDNITDSDDNETIPSSQIKSSECVIKSETVSEKANEIDGTTPNKDVNSRLATLQSSPKGESSLLEFKLEEPDKLKTAHEGAGPFISEQKNKSKGGDSFVKEKSENIVFGTNELDKSDSKSNEAIGISSPEHPKVMAKKLSSGARDVDDSLEIGNCSTNRCRKQSVPGDCDNVERSEQTLMPVVWLSPLRDHQLKSENLPQESDLKRATRSKDASPKPRLEMEPSSCKDSHSVSSSLDQSNRSSRTPELHVKEKANDSGSDSSNRSDNHAGNEETRKLRSFKKSVQGGGVDELNKNSKKSSSPPKCSPKMEKSIQKNILCAKEKCDKEEEEILTFLPVEIPVSSPQATPKYKPREENVFSLIAKRNSGLKVPPVSVSMLQKEESGLRQSSRIRQKREEMELLPSGINNSLRMSPLPRSKILQKDSDVSALRHSPRIVQKPVSFSFGEKQPSATGAKDSTSCAFLSSSILDSKKYLDFSDLKISLQKSSAESKNLSPTLKSKEDEKPSPIPTKVSDHKSEAAPLYKSSPKKCAESPFSSWKSRLRRSGMKTYSCKRSASRSSVSSSAMKLTNDDESSVEPQCSTKKHEAKRKPKKQSAKKQLSFDNANTSLLDLSLKELCLKFSSCSRSSPPADRQGKRFPSEASLQSSSKESGTEFAKKSDNNKTPSRIVSDSDISSSSEDLPNVKYSVKAFGKSSSKTSSHSSSEDSAITSVWKSVDKTPRRIVSDSDSSSSREVKSSAKRVTSRGPNAEASKSAATSKTTHVNTPDVSNEAKERGYNLRPRTSIIMPSKLQL